MSIIISIVNHMCCVIFRYVYHDYYHTFMPFFHFVFCIIMIIIYWTYIYHISRYPTLFYRVSKTTKTYEHCVHNPILSNMSLDSVKCGMYILFFGSIKKESVPVFATAVLYLHVLNSFCQLKLPVCYLFSYNVILCQHVLWQWKITKHKVFRIVVDISSG